MNVLQRIADNNTAKLGGIAPDGDAYVTQGVPEPLDYRGHRPDGGGSSKPLEGKLPWHMTFSSDSPYSTEATPGGTWGTSSKGRDTYVPSAYQIQQGYTQGLARRFADVEPDAVLLDPPAPYSRNVYR